MSEQFELFDSDGAEPRIDDLDGVLCGPGHVVTKAAQARVSVLVDEVWRAEALCAELAERGLDAEFRISREPGSPLVVATEFADVLMPLAKRWQPAKSRPSDPPQLSGHALRLWAIAAGRRVEAGYQLSLPPSDEPRWPIAGAALASVGLTATLVGPRGGGPAYRITSSKRLARLRALVGHKPQDAPEYQWP